MEVTITNNDTNSRFYGSTAYFNYSVVKKGTASNSTNQPTEQPSYTAPVQMTLYANSNSPGGYAKYKNITIKLTGTNVSVGKAAIYVNGSKVTNNNGTGVYKATKDGTYTILITYPGLNNIKFVHKVGGIDATKPSYTYTTKMNPGSNIKNLTITAKDNIGLKIISVNGTNLYKYDSKTMYYQMPVNFKVTKSGNYKIKVEDLAGNVYEKTEKITIDTTYPQFQNVIVVKDNKVGYIGNIGDSKYCKAKIGDTITVTMKAHENISGYEGIYINGKIYSKENAKVENDTLTFEIQLTQEIVDSYGLSGYVKIEVRNVRDKWGNRGNYSNDKLLYLDKTAPQIKQVTITGGTLSKNQEAIEIYKDQEIKISIIVHERLANKISINVGNYIKFATFEKDVEINGKSCSQYSATIKTNVLLKYFRSYGIENSFIPIVISGYYDNAGIMGETIKIDENNKSSNGKCLVYGKVQTGTIYFSGTEQIESPVIGDINADGYVNDYDYLLLTRQLSEIEELSEEQKKYANIDGKDSIDKKDLVELNNLIKQRENELFINSSVEFEVYDENNNQLTGEKLKITIEEGVDLITVNNTQDIITITTREESGKVVVKANYTGENGYEEQVGTIKFTIGKLHTGKGGFEVISGNNTNRKILGDVNKDGFITATDATIVQKGAINMIELTNEQKELGNVVDDGRISIFDVTAIQKLSYYNYNGMKAGDRVALKFNTFEGSTYSEFKDNSIENQIVWSTKENTDMITIRPNDEDGSAEIIINNNAEVGTRITIVCKARISTDQEEIAEFNIEIADRAHVDLTNKEIEYDLSKLEENNVVVKAVTNLSNREISWKSSDESVAKLEADGYGNIEVIPLKPGKAEISATVDGVSETCLVNVIESIKTITVDNKTIDIKETEEEEIRITVNPSTATENPVMVSENEDIAKVYEDKETETYKILGVAEGSTKITVSSPSDSEISETIEVNVKKLAAPTLTSVTIEQEEEKKLYTIGEKLNIKFMFTDAVKGDAPELKLKFGSYESVGSTKFIGFEDNNTSIVYQYTIQEGDNGILTIESMQGGSLTDNTGKLKAVLTVTPHYYEEEEAWVQEQEPEEETSESDISNINETVQTSINSIYQKNAVSVKATTAEIEEEETETDTDTEEEIITDGIERIVSEVVVDTTKPTITIIADVDKDSCWLKEGDVAKVNITANEELKDVPTVTMGGREAIVEGSGTEYTASLQVTKELEEGYLEIKINGYQDLAGNEGEEVIAKEENIDEPIIIDYSGTKIKTIELITEEGKEYKAGDQFKIRVTFADEIIDRSEYIAAELMPKIEIKFGENEAQGKLESDYIVGEYKEYITYTYTISEKDSGKISINGLSGTIQDVAGNETDLNSIKELPEITAINIENTEVDDSNGNNDETNNNSLEKVQDTKEKNDENSGKHSGILPYTGSTIMEIIILCIGISALISGTAYFITKKRNNKKYLFK